MMSKSPARALAVVVALFSLASSCHATLSTSNGQLLRDGKPVRLHGIGSTTTEYLLRGIGMKSFVNYNWNDPSQILSTLDMTEISAFTSILTQANSTGIEPVVRIPLTASYYLGVVTSAARGNFGKYPNLGAQYRGLIKSLVSNYTSMGINVVLDLHWNDDDTEQQPMAMKSRSDSGPTGNAIDFWAAIAADSDFSNNPHVLFELYNEPHTDVNTWMNGNSQYAGMLEMISTIRGTGANNMLVIAGAAAYAYDASSLVALYPKLPDKNVMFNFHPYMGPAQAGASNKCPSGFNSMVKQITSATTIPIIITEFGQACCATNGACESCSSLGHGYDEDILGIMNSVGGSWMPWAWRPGAGSTGGPNCQDLNGGSSPSGLSLVHPTNGQGGDWATLWPEYNTK